MDKDELLNRIRVAVESDEDEIVRCIEIKFLFDEYERCQREVELKA